MFKTRLISGIILVAAAVVTVCAGGVVLFFTCLALSLIAAGELFLACGIREEEKLVSILDGLGYAGIVITYLGVAFLPQRFHFIVLVFAFFIITFGYVFTFPRFDAWKVFAVFFGVVYTGFMISCIYQARLLDRGAYHVWLIFLSAWGADTFAYLAGMKFGKHKLAPVLSPKKTVEGAIGGILGAVILGLIFALCTKGPILIYMLICFFASIISMLGDLTASAIKRNMEIKDFSNLIPGHGGILDRFDSIIFTAPVIFYLSDVLIK